MITLIIDCNYLCHRARFKLENLDSKDAGIIFGFLKEIIFLSRKFDSNQFVFCWDSRKSFRKEQYPQYKATRHKRLTEYETKEIELVYKQFTQIRKEVLPALGAKNTIVQRGIEADDLIALAVTRKYKELPIVVSTDGDLFQLLDNCVMFNPKKKTLYTKADFINEYNIEPVTWPFVKALAGCGTDNIAGIEGVGEKTAIKFFKGDLVNNRVVLQRILDQNHDVIERNLPLVKLPHAKAQIFPIKKQKQFEEDGFFNVCQKYDFKSFMEEEYYEKICKYFLRG